MKASSAVGEGTKTIVESVITSGLSPEEILKQLDSCDIDWYVTEKGDLMIRYWQLGAEDFLPIERTARIRENQTTPRGGSALEWLSRHLTEIKTRYANRWVAIVDDKIVADAGDLAPLLQRIEVARIEHPFVTFIPGEPIIWATAYGQ